MAKNSLKYSMKHETKPLTSSQNATAQIPSGGKIQSMILHFMTSAGATVTEAQIRSEISSVRMTMNGSDIVNMPIVNLLDFFESLGSEVFNNTAVAGCVELNIGRLLFTDPAVRDLFGYGTSDVSSIQVQVQAGTLSAIASFEVHTFRTPDNEPLGAYAKLVNYPQSYNAAGQHTVDTLPRNVTSQYLSLLIDDGASGTISASEVRLNGAIIREAVPLNVNKQWCSECKLEQPSGYFHAAFNDGSINSSVPMKGVNDFRVLTTFSVAPGAAGYNISALTLENMPS